ncbi:MAG: sugar-phosphatase [Clostridium sp.]
MYKLIALDIDGTLVTKKAKITEKNLLSIAEAKKKGVKIVLASGRPLNGLNRFLKELDLINKGDYAVGFNGAIVQDTYTEEIITMTTLNIDCYKELYDISLKMGVNIHALTKVKVITPKINKYSQLEADLNGIEIEEISLENIGKEETIVKVMMIDDPILLDNVVANLSEDIKERYTIFKSAPYFLEFLHKDVNKWSGVFGLAHKLGIKTEEIICVGDEENDIHMIENAGLGVAMGNAVTKIKEVADYITLSNEESGVAHVINKFILNKEDEEYTA